MLPQGKLDTLLARHAELEAELSRQLAGDAFVKLSREFAEISPIVETVKDYRAVAKEIADLEQLMADASTGAEMRQMAEAELLDLNARRDKLEQDIRIHLIPKDAMDDRNVILEIRAGTGGDEASLFAGTLFRMYERYAAKQGWKTEIVSESPGSVGGFKEIVAEIRGRGAFSKLKFESGVHRVQRVPDTEASGRIHTSAATVAVLPEVEDVDVQINEQDLKIDTLRASGAGGQHVNKTKSAIRLTHLPTGIVVAMQEDRSQHRNKAKAMAVLRARLYEHEREKRDAARSADRRDQIGSGDRSERIRTYNFPQGRVTDHRINLTLYKLPQVIEGEVARRTHRRARHREPGRAARGDKPTHDHDGAEARRPDHGRRASPGCQHAPRERNCVRGSRCAVACLRRACASIIRRWSAMRRGHCRMTMQRRWPRSPRAGSIANPSLAFSASRNSGACRSGSRLRRWCRGGKPKPSSKPRSPPWIAAETKTLRIADIGTGSGAILLALLREMPNAFGVGTDRSMNAIVTARGNAIDLGFPRSRGFCGLRLFVRACAVPSTSWCRTRPTSRAGISIICRWT